MSLVRRTVSLSLLLAFFLGVTPPASAGKPDLSDYGNPWARVTVGRTIVRAEVVSSPEKIYLGLSYREGMPDGQGMLFVMPEEAVQDFCMRGMRFPLDIIWIARGRVIGCERRLSPEDPGTFSSPAPAGHVLEVPGGFCDRHGIKAGDRVTIE